MQHDFDGIRAELGLPPAAETDRFPNDVLAEAASIAARAPADIDDATDMAFVTIDPLGSKDLDQAILLERTDEGFTVHYAIADLGSSIAPGGPVDVEARRRGQTIYLPDGRVPLHPPVLSEGALSLLPDQVRPAAVWTIAVDADGVLGEATVRRARIRSVAQLDYEGVQQSFDAGTPHPSIEPLADLGRLRQQVRVARGAIELALPEQEIVRAGDGWRIAMRVRTHVDAWNAEVSLLTGMAAARLMIFAQVGMLRTLPPAPDHDEIAFLRTARSLGVTVAEGTTPARVLADLDPVEPASLAVMTEATRLLRGAGYEAFDGKPPAQPEHAGIGGPYAHVTAPLRRLADRFCGEVCLAISAGREVPAWVKEALVSLPEIMQASDQRASRAERACIDQTEVWMLAGRIGETFDAIVLHGDDEDGDVMLLDPPVVARCTGRGLHEGARARVTLVAVDAEKRAIALEYGGAAATS